MGLLLGVKYPELGLKLVCNRRVGSLFFVAPTPGKMAWLLMAPNGSGSGCLSGSHNYNHILYPSSNFTNEDQHSGMIVSW